MCGLGLPIHSFIDESRRLFDYSKKSIKHRTSNENAPVQLPRQVCGLPTRAFDGCSKEKFLDHDGLAQHCADGIRIGEIVFATNGRKAVETSDSEFGQVKFGGGCRLLFHMKEQDCG